MQTISNPTFRFVKALLEKNELDEYEKNLGQSVVDYFQKHKVESSQYSCNTSAWSWCYGLFQLTKEGLECAIVREEIAEMAYYTVKINPNIEQTELSEILYEKHFERKNGINKYYGQ